MIQNFTNEELLAASCQLAVENNVMLKIVLSNQVAIMKKLGITPEVNLTVEASLIPKFNPPGLDHDVIKMFNQVASISRLENIKLNEFVFDFKRIRNEIKKDPDPGVELNDKK
jgi:hypothetical protein